MTEVEKRRMLHTQIRNKQPGMRICVVDGEFFALAAWGSWISVEHMRKAERFCSEKNRERKEKS